MKDLFYVGQRVKVIQCKSMPSLVGREGVIVAPRKRYEDWEYGVWWGYTTTIEPDCYRPAEHCLEPIYDGDEKTSWSECAWQPHKEHA